MEEVKIERYLLNKGIPPQIKGFRYMTTAIQLCQKNPDYLYSITKKLYPKVASTHHDTYSKAERAMRHAITFLGKSTTNSEFIGTALIELKELYAIKKRGAKNV